MKRTRQAKGEVPENVNVRSAKAQLSRLLEWAADGREITITSGGAPKARLMPLERPKPRKPFGGAKAHLRKMGQPRSAPRAEQTIREDRDSRG